MSWLQPIKPVEKIGGGFFKVNDRRIQKLTESAVVWNDVEYPKVSKEAYSDRYRIQALNCHFRQHLDTHSTRLVAVQFIFESIEEPNEVIPGPICGIKEPNVPWSFQLELMPDEHIIGMRSLKASEMLIKTSHNRVVNMLSGESVENGDLWTLPCGFRVYGFHGVFDESHIIYLGPVFKARDLKHWDQELYRELPPTFKVRFRSMLLIKYRHKTSPPESPSINFWEMPEVAWDKIINQLLYDCYYDMDTNAFFADISKYYRS